MIASKNNTTMIFLSFFSLVLLSTLNEVEGEKILVLHPVYAGSHVAAVRTITTELVNRGHQIRVIRWLESSNIPEINNEYFNETVLAVNNSLGTIPFMTREEKAKFQFPGSLMWERGLNPFSVFDGGMQAVEASCIELFQQKSLIEELKKEKYKVAIVDIIYNECGLALAHHLNIPVVGYWALFFMSGEAQYTTAFNFPSVIPHTYIQYTSQMNFFQRIHNFVWGIGSHLVMQLHFYYADYQIKKHGITKASSAELIANISGMLINSHPSFDYPKSLPPSFFHIGGLHIKDHKPLKGELREFLENSKAGVILFSLGGNFGSEALPVEIFESYFRVFGKLKQNVIVKSNSYPSELPKNVKIMSHIPQCDILAHPNTVLFMTHCGMHGVMEAIHHGIKMVGIPIFFDQGNVAIRLREKGVAVLLNKQSTENEIYQAILEALTNDKYEKNIKELSSLYQHSFESPLARSVWLVEHVMEFNGAHHLKLETKDMSLIQIFSVDVILVLLLAVLVLMYSFYQIYKQFIPVKRKYKKL